MLSDFKTHVSAKWILAGEHAVVRQHPAIVFPLPHYLLSLDYRATTTPWQIEVQGRHADILKPLLLPTLTQALTYSENPLVEKTGEFIIHNEIPLGNGLGASAAFCLALSRWLAAQNLINSQQIHAIAKKIENLFHGQSSGLDIVGSAAQVGQYFHLGSHRNIEQTWQPNWYLSASGSHCKTSDCIKKSTVLAATKPKKSRWH